MRVAALLLWVGCVPPPVSSGTGGGSGNNDGGGNVDGGTGGGSVDGGPWQWLPIDGSLCGSGSTAGIAIKPGASDQLFVFMQGGGACWNTGTCRPSLYQFGPVCYYDTVCLASGQGADQPLAVHVTDSDPYPADGGGALPGDLAVLESVKALDRASLDNPFRNATFVYVPYCTGDLHSGSTTQQYPYKLDLIPGNVYQFTMHFNGAANMDLFLARLTQLYPAAKTVWLTGSSAGGYGATFNFDRVARAFSTAKVELLADSSPFIETPHFTEWRDAWSMQFPSGCTACADGGLPAVVEYLAGAWPDRRLALLSYDQDQVIRYFFFGGSGPDQVANPPLGVFETELSDLETRYDAHPNARYFVPPGNSHVLWGDYGYRLSDGGWSTPRPSRDGGTNLKAFIDGWATGDAGFDSSR